MLDKPEKTYQLLAAPKAAVPFEVELTPSLIAHLQAQQVAVAVKPHDTISQIAGPVASGELESYSIEVDFDPIRKRFNDRPLCSDRKVEESGQLLALIGARRQWTVGLSSFECKRISHYFYRVAKIRHLGKLSLGCGERASDTKEYPWIRIAQFKE